MSQPLETPLTLAEMRADLEATSEDIRRLTLIARNLEAFIAHSHGEDRGAFKTDLLKYDALLAQATRLKGAIEARIAQAGAGLWRSAK